MTTKNFDATPPSEPISLEQISKENVKDAWKEYEAKPEYKEFNKHDLIESMQSDHEIRDFILMIKNKKAHCCELFLLQVYFNNGGTAS
jgi:hypothetical protein